MDAGNTNLDGMGMTGMALASTRPTLPKDPRVVTLIAVLGTWSAVWKAAALWRAASNRSVPWFIALFLANTLGALEIFYIFRVSPRRQR